MGKFKKLVMALCLAGSLGCLAGAAACTQQQVETPPEQPAPEYYRLVTTGTGVEYYFRDNMDGFLNGGTVKEGVTVSFTVSLGNNAVGTPTILLNGTALTPDANGVYSFVMEEESTISATGVNLLSTITFDKTQSYFDENGNEYVQQLPITYYDAEGNELGDSVQVVDGQPFSFGVKVSVYYKQNYSVLYNAEQLTVQDGLYTYDAVNGDATISLLNVEQEDAFPQLTDGGTGTRSDPYKLRRPIDLYYMAAFINNSFYGGLESTKYYRLENDIDMEGEQLYVVGDNSNAAAVFCGTFDGNGHTISNFYITDEVVDQETLANEYLPYVGLFGYATASMTAPAVIKNVTLDNFEVRTHPGAAKVNTYVGSLLGFGIGVDVYGCTVKNGTITAEGDDSQMFCMGGIAGVLQAAYSTATQPPITFNSGIYACSTDVTVDGSGSPRAAGGIVGYLVSADVNAIAYVSDCYSLGDVFGGIHTGGIVGTLGMYSSVANSYALGGITSNNYINLPGLLDDYRVAYAGGIVGYAENDTIISGCYAGNAYLDAYSVSVSGSSPLVATGDICASYASAGEISITSQALMQLNCLDKDTAANDQTFKNTLGWNSGIWSFGGTYPTINASSAISLPTVNIKVNAGNSQVATASNAGYAPMSGWYTQGKLDEFLTSDAGRSWGYYFDKDLTQKVPAGFVPVKDITLYAGFADYGDVAGRYYINVADAAVENGTDTVDSGRLTDFVPGSAYLELTADGKTFFRYGGMTYSSSYTYDGNKISIADSAMLSAVFSDAVTQGSVYSFEGSVSDNLLTLRTNARVVTSGSGDSAMYGNITVTLGGLKDNTSIAYGSYRAANGNVYTFTKDGSGTRVSGEDVTTFTYTVSTNGGTVTVTSSLGAIVVGADGKISSIDGATVSLLDEYYGTWSKDANARLSYTFDGLGSVTYNAFSGSVVANYTLEGDRIVFTLDGTRHEAYFVDGGLVIDGEQYSRADGVTGTWFYWGKKEQIEITLGGIGANGYGKADLSYLGVGVTAQIEAEYTATVIGGNTVVRIYAGNTLYAEVVRSGSSSALSGAVYSQYYGQFVEDMSLYLYDAFRGTWMSSTPEFDTVTFNGRGAYNTTETETVFAISGTVTVKAAGGRAVSGDYTLTSATAGTMTVGGKTYAISLDESTGMLSIVADGTDAESARSDRWQGITLYDGDGVGYTFDGKGGIGGTVTLSTGEKLTYTLAGGMPVIEGEALTAAGDHFTLGELTLSFKAGFAGDWTAQGGISVSITEVTADFTATLTFDGEQYVLSYDRSSNSLTGSGITVTRLGSYELLISGSASGDIMCITNSRLDGWQGKTFAQGNASWTFDGLGKGVYTKGTAVYTVDGDSSAYSYTVNDFGTPVVDMDGTQVFVLTNTQSGYAAEDGAKYDFVRPDAMYARRANSADGKTAFYFDGGNSVYASTDGGKTYSLAYTYEVVSETQVTLTDGEGASYSGTLTSSGNYYTLTIAAANN